MYGLRTRQRKSHMDLAWRLVMMLRARREVSRKFVIVRSGRGARHELRSARPGRRARALASART